MKNVILVLLTLLSTQLFAQDRTHIAEHAEQVTPVLNGTQIPAAEVWTIDNKLVDLAKLTKGKPSLILFYRGGWCPYCNRQLAGLQKVEEELLKKGVQILAISPDTPERLLETRLETKSGVTLLADPKLNATRNFGLAYFLDDKTAKRYRNSMGSIFATADGDRIVLPAPAAYLIDKNGTIVFNYVNPNYKVRVTSEMLMAAADLALE